MEQVRFMLNVLVLISAVLASAAFALESLPNCSTHVIIKWTPGGEVDYGEFYPEGGEAVLPDEVNKPRVLTVDSKGDIYVADPVNYRVLKFSKNGQLILKFSLQKPLLAAKPPIGNVIEDMTVDTHDNLYLINLYEYRIEIYNPKGKFLKSINYLNDNLGQGKDLKMETAGLGLEPKYLGIDKDGQIYIYRDYRPNMALGGIYSPDGQLIKRGIIFHDFGGTKKDFERRLINFSGYYLDVINRRSAAAEDNSIAILKKADGKELSKCTFNVEPTTKTYIDKTGNDYFFEINTLNVTMARMLQGK